MLDPCRLASNNAGMGVDAVLFDKDGTLIDFHATWIPAYRAGARLVAERIGDPALASLLLAVGGYDDESDSLVPESLLAVGTTGAIAAFFVEQARAHDPDSLVREVEQVFHEHATSQPRPTADLAEILQRLRDRDVALGVATQDASAAAREGLQSLGIAHFFQYIAGFDAGHGVKPEPGMVEGFAAAVGRPVQAMALVGDTVSDMKMGRAAGVGTCVGVLSGISSEDELSPWADIVIPSVADLEDALW